MRIEKISDRKVFSPLMDFIQCNSKLIGALNRVPNTRGKKNRDDESAEEKKRN